MAIPTNIVQGRFLEGLNTIGQAAMSAMFPNDFEVYLCSIELTTSKGVMIDSFTFPVMPDSIERTENKRTTVQTTATGSVILTSPYFVPQDITIRGNFGRAFKILASDKDPGTTGVAFSVKAGKYNLYQIGKKKLTDMIKPFFDVGVKTGYGATKILKGIISKSNGLDSDGKPFKLFFNNMAFGESYLVVIPPNGAVFSQNMQKNMIWEYSLTMLAIAPAEAVGNETDGKSLVKAVAKQQVAKSVVALANTIKGML